MDDIWNKWQYPTVRICIIYDIIIQESGDHNLETSYISHDQACDTESSCPINKGSFDTAMYTIAICDDEPAFLELLGSLISEEFRKRALNVRVPAYDKADGLLNELKKSDDIDAVFSDIAMPGINGIQAGKWLRNNTANTPLIYVSNRDDMVFKTFQARPLQYIRKDRLREELPAVIDELIKELQNRKKDDAFEVTADNREIFRFHKDEIMYIEVTGKECRVWVTDKRENVTVRCRLKVFEDFLEDKGFIKIHKSFLVNYRFIFQIRATEVLLDNETLLPISRHRLNEVKEKFMEYTVSGDSR